MVNRQKIIVVDDSEICRDTAQVMLEEAGFEVITLGSPLGFSKTLLAEKPHLALVDVSMPALKGNQLVSIAHKVGTDAICPIVLFSDQPEATLDSLSRSCGAAGYIRKSDDWPGIVRAIQSYISRGR